MLLRRRIARRRARGGSAGPRGGRRGRDRSASAEKYGKCMHGEGRNCDPRHPRAGPTARPESRRATLHASDPPHTSQHTNRLHQSQHTGYERGTAPLPVAALSPPPVLLTQAVSLSLSSRFGSGSPVEGGRVGNQNGRLLRPHLRNREAIAAGPRDPDHSTGGR